MINILLIDDDEQIGQRLQTYFQQFEFNLSYATNPVLGLTLLEKNDFDLVILDIMMPDIDGLALCKRVRSSKMKYSDVPIIMLSARVEVMDRVLGIELGADDYLAKPFEPRELIVRIQAILKRTSQPNRLIDANRKKMSCYGEIEINLDYRQVSIRRNNIELTAKEYALLCLFVQAPGKNFTRDDILSHISGIEADLFSRSIDILISRLRNKLKPTDYIKTVWGIGYCFSINTNHNAEN